MNATPIAILTVALLAMGVTACGSDSSDDGTGADAPTTPNPETTAPGPIPVDTAIGTDGGGYGPSTVDLELTGDRTTAISEPLPDGVYFSPSYTADGNTVTFSLTQYFQCDSSTNVPDEPSVQCASGFGTLDEPSTRADLAPNAVVTVATGDLADPTRADVTPAEFTRLVSGEPPAADAPVGYTFSNFFVFVEVEDGTVVRVQQFYTS